jgi:hypothetical protein
MSNASRQSAAIRLALSLLVRPVVIKGRLIMSKEFANSGDGSHTSSIAESVSFSAFQQFVSSELSLVSSLAAMRSDLNNSPNLGEVILLTPELKTAVDNSSIVTVRFSSADTSGVDLVIKRDGTIEHYLNMDPNSYVKRNLIVAIEDDSNFSRPITDQQAETLNQLFDFCKSANKEVHIDQSSLKDASTWTSDEGRGRTERRNYSQPDNRHRVSDRFDSGLIKPSSVATDYVASGTTDSDFKRGSNSSSRISPPVERSGAGTGSNTSYWSSPRYDWTNVDLSKLLTDWFSADPESFKKLMPGLYKKLAGANGRIDPRKLRHMIDRKDPLLTNLKEKLPALADSFHTTNQSSEGKVATSDCAVSPTGAVLADKAAQVSDELGGSGYCAKGVSFAIERATGKVIWGNANDMRESLPNQGFTVANSKDLKVGQVVHVYWTPEVYEQEQARRGPCANYGDIAVIGKGRDGQLYAYNDAATPLNDYLQKSRYDWNTLKVFNPPNV